MLEADNFELHCFQAPTGTKFVVTTEKQAQNMDAFFKSLYEIYADYVLKNPFYEMDMPIRCGMNNRHILMLWSRNSSF